MQCWEMDRWAGRVAVVTGASSGIGAAIARDLVGHGLTVVGMARRDDRIKALAEELKGSKGKLHAVKVDLNKEPDIVSAFGWIEANLGPVSILINNAGISEGEKRGLIAGKSDIWRTVMEVNVLGLSICSQIALKMMRAHGVDDGHIVNINSIAGHSIILHEMPIYHASKHSVTVLTECLRRELVAANSNIKVTSVSPGLVESEMAQEYVDMGLPHLKAKEVSGAVMYVLGTPPHMLVSEITVRPVKEKFN